MIANPERPTFGWETGFLSTFHRRSAGGTGSYQDHGTDHIVSFLRETRISPVQRCTFPKTESFMYTRVVRANARRISLLVIIGMGPKERDPDDHQDG